MTGVSFLKIALFMGLLPCVIGMVPTLCGQLSGKSDCGVSVRKAKSDYPERADGKTTINCMSLPLLILKSILWGWFIMFALFEVLAVPMIMTQQKFSLLSSIYAIVVWIVFAISIIGSVILILRSGSLSRVEGNRAKEDHNMPDSVSDTNNIGKNLCENGKLNKNANIIPTIVLWCIFALSVAFQMYFVSNYTHYDGDDSYYVAQSVITEHYDTMYVRDTYTEYPLGGIDSRHAFAALPMYILWQANMCDIHVTAFSHSVMSWAMIFLMYGIYVLIAIELFQQRNTARESAGAVIAGSATVSDIGNAKVNVAENKTRIKNSNIYIPIFLIMLSAWYMFASSSLYTAETFALTRTWQGKSAFGNLLIPMAIYLLLLLFRSSHQNRNERTRRLLIFIGIGLLGITGVLFTTASIYLFSLLMAMYGLFSWIMKKNFRDTFFLILACLPQLIIGAVYYIAR